MAQRYAFTDPEGTVRPKKNTAIKRNQTFAAADRLSYTPKSGAQRRRGGKFRCYTVPLFPALSASVEVLNTDHSSPPVHALTTAKRAALSRDQLHRVSTILPLPDQYQFSPGVRSASSGFGSIGLAWSEASFRSFNRSLTATSPDSAISLFSSAPSKTGSVVAKKRLQLEADSADDYRVISKRAPAARLPARESRGAEETRYVTSVFQVLGQGLGEIVEWMSQEMHHFCSQGLVIVCCEMSWSTPDQYRNIGSETRLKEHLLRGLRANNSRVWEAVEGAQSVTEETVVRKWSCTAGAYRRYYAGLLAMAHEETARQHEPWWRLRTGCHLEASVQWPAIGSKDQISVLMLNMICLKL